MSISTANTSIATPATSFTADPDPDPDPTLDPFNLNRFVKAQDENDIFNRILATIREGRRKPQPATWIWFVFPQMDKCLTRERRLKHRHKDVWPRGQALTSLDEARAYLRHPILGPRIREAAQALLDSPFSDKFSVMVSTFAVLGPSKTAIRWQERYEFGFYTFFCYVLSAGETLEIEKIAYQRVAQDNMFYDVERLHSSMTIFRQAARYPSCIHQTKHHFRENYVFRRVLDRYFVEFLNSDDEDDILDQNNTELMRQCRGKRHGPTINRLDALELEAIERRLAKGEGCVCGRTKEELELLDEGSKRKIVTYREFREIRMIRATGVLVDLPGQNSGIPMRALLPTPAPED